MVSKSQLAQRIAARGASPSQAQHAVDAVLGEITAALASGEKVTLLGFGTFEPVARAARTARNPRTGASVTVAAATVARFHPGTGLKAAVDGGPVTLGAVGPLPDQAAGQAASVVVPTRGKAPRAKAANAAKLAPGAGAAKPAKTAGSAKAAKPAKEPKAKGKADKGKKAAKKHKG